MTRSQDIRELIAESGARPSERRALEAVADKLDDALSADVPARPAFKAQLRQQLMEQARRVSPPWYRRPAVWGLSAGVAAAAVILAVGLQLVNKGVPQPGNRNLAKQEAPPADRAQSGPGVQVQGHLVNRITLPAVSLPDQPATPGLRPEPLPDVSQGVTVYLLTTGADASLFQRIAGNLGFQQPAQQISNGRLTVSDERRTLTMTSDGLFSYADTTAESGATIASPAAAQAVAQRFLERAVLPVPSLDPDVTQRMTEGKRIFTVLYVPRVDGHPVIGANTVVDVTEQGHVLSAEAYAQAKQEPQGLYDVIPPAEALSRAAQQGGTFTQADLVYVRTLDQPAVWLQPYWRVFGTDARGAQVLRYVAALVPKETK